MATARKTKFILMLLILLAIIINGCTAPELQTTQQNSKKAEESYIENVAQIVKETNWDETETITVELNELSFTPSTIKFKKDTPYKLEIKNIGNVKHYFTSIEFFKAVASRKVQSNSDGEIKAPYFSALEVFPGRQLDFYFVPIKEGSYYLKCTIEGHEEKGMHGTIIIE